MNNPFEILLKDAEKKEVHQAPIGFVDTSGNYRIGPPTRPPIKFDNGFLDKFPRREPTAADRIALAKWKLILEGSEAFCNGQTGSMIDRCKNDDLADANAAYRHFLEGNGEDRTINYERYLKDDPQGVALLSKLAKDFRTHIEIIGKDRKKFSVTSAAFSVGNSATAIAEYPSTANWQKTIGAHTIWVSANITISAVPPGILRYNCDVTIYMEDMYNFNPGAADIASGIPDSENGRFEITGLGKQYVNRAIVQRNMCWDQGSVVVPSVKGAPTERQRKPSNNRRARNRI